MAPDDLAPPPGPTGSAGTEPGAVTPPAGSAEAPGAAADVADPLGARASDAPPVVAVVVTHDPGSWLEECLASLVAQDYPNLSILVVDADSSGDVVPRVASVAPGAYVRRLDGNPGFGAAANEVLEVVEGAAFFAFCHDDVRLERTAVRILVEEAFRSNAGIVGPKLVAWGAPDRLLQVGMSVDKTGVMAPLVERGELDQEQHDRVRDVFLLPGACLVVRADLFIAIGGFDPAITFLGDDLDLCWRAQVAGARVMVVPEARVEHRESLGERRPVDDRRRLLARHRLRTTLVSYSLFHLLRVLPQAAVFAVIEAVYALISGRPGQARDVAGAWVWNLRRLGEVRDGRRRLRQVRRFGDREVRRLQITGSARVTGFVRGEIGTTDRVRATLAEVGRDISGRLGAGPTRVVAAAWIVIGLVLVVGSRGLLFGHVPAVAGLIPFDESPFDLLRQYASGWRATGVGAEAPSPTALGLLGLTGVPLLGAMGLLRHILVLGALPVGIIGVWRLTAHLDSRRARAVAIVLYAAVPLPYDALARGRWGGLLLYAASPFLLRRLLALSGEPPFARPGDRRRPVLALALLLALLTAFVPVAAPLLIVMAGALAVGGLLSGGARSLLPALSASLVAAGVAAAVHFPWSLDLLLPGSQWQALGGVSPFGTDELGLGAALRMETGPAGSALNWAVPVAAALPLLIGRGWRLTWAIRLWTLAVALVALVWAGGRDLLGVPVPPAEVLLAPAAAALALAAGLGMAAFERDLPGYRFGWRQIASLAAAGGVIVAMVPVAVDALGGRWDLPEGDLSRTLRFLGEDATEGAFRTLWMGHPDVLPLAGHHLADDLHYGVSTEGVPGLADRWATPSTGSDQLVAAAVRLAAEGRTERLGRLLAPFGIRYIALPDRAAPLARLHRPVPADVERTVGQQLDLRRLEVEESVTLYENVAWAPVRATLDERGAEAVEASALFRTAVGLDLSGARPVLPPTGRRYQRFEGQVPPGTVYLATPASERWSLEVNGERAERSRALGWANAFEVEEAGEATLRYRTSPTRWLAVLLQALLWAALIALVVRERA